MASSLARCVAFRKNPHKTVVKKGLIQVKRYLQQTWWPNPPPNRLVTARGNPALEPPFLSRFDDNSLRFLEFTIDNKFVVKLAEEGVFERERGGELKRGKGLRKISLAEVLKN